jgi:hypothetical protein
LSLCLPLKGIARESHVQTPCVRARDQRPQPKLGQLAQLSIRFRDGETPFINAIIVSEESKSGLAEQA